VEFFIYGITVLDFLIINIYFVFLDEVSVVTPSLNRANIRFKDKKESSYTLLTIVSCIVYLVGNFIDCFSIIAAIFSFDIYNKYGFINISGNVLFYASHSVHLFMYYRFNNAFKKQFNAFFGLT